MASWALSGPNKIQLEGACYRTQSETTPAIVLQTGYSGYFVNWLGEYEGGLSVLLVFFSVVVFAKSELKAFKQNKAFVDACTKKKSSKLVERAFLLSKLDYCNSSPYGCTKYQFRKLKCV